MILGTVTGHLWGTRKCARLTGKKLLFVRLERSYNHYADHVVAIDDVGAEIGQQVLICMGAPPRWIAGDTRVPVNAAVAAIVDEVVVETT
ncbi:MAG TPA: ethanolamine utilization protein EutN [Myxococcales bacterium]|nr:ethanolamine utilization protein EutN [Myxococcales bacterium]HIN85324.1 ethanolamine utilization protein EutN [Myxococcales bacterium]